MNYKFVKNMIADTICDHPGVYAGKSSSTATIKNSFTSCLFENENGLLEPYNGQPSCNSRAHIGIDIENLTLLKVNTQIAQRNSFKNISYGIWGKRSNLEVSGAEFINTDGSVSAGIELKPAGSITKIVDNNYFQNLISAINVKGGIRPDITIENNEFKSTRTFASYIYTILVVNTSFANVKIQNKNKFDYYQATNIDISDISGSISYLKIDDNDFKMSGNMVDPIKIVGVKFPSWITNNRFTVNYSNYGRSMVTLKNCSMFVVENNDMYDGATASFARGFDISGTDKSLFKNNEIYFPGKGFYVLGSEAVSSNGFCCNTVTGYPNYPSFKYYYENGGTYFRQNTLGKLELPGNFGKQYDAGNIWTGAGNTAFLENGTFDRAYINQFKVNQNVPGGLPAIIIPSQISEEWFKGRGLHPTCAERPDCGIPPFIKEPKNPDPPVIVNPDCEEIIQVYIRLMRIRSGNPDGEAQLAQYSLEAILS
jgi:hypothetical protein